MTRTASFSFWNPLQQPLLGVYPANRSFDVAALADLQGLSMILQHAMANPFRRRELSGPGLRSLGRNRQPVHSAPWTPSMPHAHVPFPSDLAAYSPPSHHTPFLHPSRNRTPLPDASNVPYMPHLAWHHLFRCIAQVIAVKRCTPLSSHSFPYLEFGPCYIPGPFNVRKSRSWLM